MGDRNEERHTAGVALTVEQMKYLVERLELPPPLRDILRGGSARALTLTRDQARQLMAAVSTRLQMAGFDEAYVPTEEGTMLESIIDRLTGVT